MSLLFSSGSFYPPPPFHHDLAAFSKTSRRFLAKAAPPPPYAMDWFSHLLRLGVFFGSFPPLSDCIFKPPLLLLQGFPGGVVFLLGWVLAPRAVF